MKWLLVGEGGIIEGWFSEDVGCIPDNCIPIEEEDWQKAIDNSANYYHPELGLSYKEFPKTILDYEEERRTLISAVDKFASNPLLWGLLGEEDRRRLIAYRYEVANKEVGLHFKWPSLPVDIGELI